MKDFKRDYLVCIVLIMSIGGRIDARLAPSLQFALSAATLPLVRSVQGNVAVKQDRKHYCSIRVDR